MKWFLLLAIFLAVTAFMLDAFFAHGLKSFLGDRFQEASLHALSTAARYQLLSGFFLLILIVIYRHYPFISVVVSGLLSIVGVLLFCGAIYLKHIFFIATFARVAPLGGICFMLSFLALLPLFLSL